MDSYFRNTLFLIVVILKAILNAIYLRPQSFKNFINIFEILYYNIDIRIVHCNIINFQNISEQILY